MIALVCLTIAVVCAIISRILLLIAALDISVWWAVGVFLPRENLMNVVSRRILHRTGLALILLAARALGVER